MEKFIKITEKLYYDENTADIGELLNSKNSYMRFCDLSSYEMEYDYSLIDCESPIEQLLAAEIYRIGLVNFINFNDEIDVVAIEKQVEIETDKKTYRVDFLIPVIYKPHKKEQYTKNYIIECDGHEFHQKTKKQVEYDNERQRSLQRSGYEIIRFSGTEIWHKPYQCACEIRNTIKSGLKR